MHSAMMESIYFCISSVNEIVNCFPRFHRNHQITISKFMQSADINFENETNCIPIVFISGFLIIRHFHLRFNVVFGHSGGRHVLFHAYSPSYLPIRSFSAVPEKKFSTSAVVSSSICAVCRTAIRFSVPTSQEWNSVGPPKLSRSFSPIQ